MNLWKKISFIMFIIVLFFSSIIIFLISTMKGLNVLLYATNHFFPGIKIEKVYGSSWKNLHFKNICYERPNIFISIDDLHLSIDINHLYSKELFIDNLLLKDIYIEINSKKLVNIEKIKKNYRDDNSHYFSSPYPINVKYIALNNASIKIGNTNILILNFISSLQWYKKKVTLKKTSLKEVFFTFPKEESSFLKKILNIKVKDLKIEKELFGERIKNFFSKPILPETINIHFPFDLNLEEFKGEKLYFNGNTNFVVYDVFLKIYSIDNNIYLNLLKFNSSWGLFDITGRAQLYDNWLINITINSLLTLNSFQEEKIELKINGALRKKINLNLNLFGPLKMVLFSQIQLSEPGLPLNINIIGHKLFWPLFGKRKYQIYNLKFQFSKKITDYTIFFRTSLQSKNFPITTIVLNARGNEQRLNINKLIIFILKGKLELISTFDWKESISWYSKLKFSKINLEKEILNYPMILNGQIKIFGDLYNNSWRIDIPKIEIVSDIEKNKLLLRGAIQGDNHLRWNVLNLDLIYGCNSVTIRGKFINIKDLNLRLIIDAPNLDSALFKFGGKAKGLISIIGTTNFLELFTDLEINELKWKELSINRLHINSNVISSGQIYGKLNLYAEKIIQSNMNMNSVILAIEGNEKKHQLQLYTEGEPISSYFRMIGFFNRREGYWKCWLDNGSDLKDFIKLHILIQSSFLRIPNLRKENNIQFNNSKKLDEQLHTKKIITNSVRNRKIENFQYLSWVTSKPSFLYANQENRIFNKKINIIYDLLKEDLSNFRNEVLSGRSAKILFILGDKILSMKFHSLDLKIKLRNDLMEINWLFFLAENSRCNGNIRITNFRNDYNISGSLNIRNYHLTIDNEKTSGILNTKLRFFGKIESPKIFGQVHLDKLEIDKENIVPFDMEPSQFLIRFNGVYSTLHGKIYTKKGFINLKGNANWKQINNWNMHLSIKGFRIFFKKSPAMNFEISPNITLEAKPRIIIINGYINLPWADITLNKFPKNTIAVSNDEVILNENLKTIKKNSLNTTLNSNIVIYVGNRVKINAFGLKAKLIGNLRIIQDKRGLSVNGQINIPEGRFRAYGQDLLVNKGELLFSGPPDQPLLNIKAVRNPEITEDNVIVGLYITGTLKKPKVKIFSYPSSLSQKDTLSYLLRGQQLNNYQKDSQSVILTLVGLGITKSNSVIEKIGKILGIKSLMLDTQGIGKSSQLVISSFLLPNLQAKYGLGIFDSFEKMTLRYRLMSNLYLEAISSFNKAIGLLYLFEF